jgi:CheY-like chemotaxis protein
VRRRSVLILADAQEQVTLLRATLEQMGMVTAHESRGLRALARYTEMHPDLVLIDLALPEISHWKVMDSIRERQRETNGKTPAVVAITRYGEVANRLVSQLQGVYGYLLKPFSGDDVERAVRSALSAAR